MARRIPPHKSLNENVPPGWSGGQDELVVTLTYEKPDLQSDQIRFIFEISANFDYCEPEGDLIFEIQRDCTVKFILANKLNSRWSDQYFFITSKRSHKRLYGDVNLVNEKTFTIKAKYDRSGNLSAKQSFNLNIDYGQIEGLTGWLYVPITIDPDVGNPRPPGLRAIIAGSKSAPVLGNVGDVDQ